MPAAHEDLQIEQGVTFRVTFEYRDPPTVPTDPPGSGAPIDLSGYTAAMQIRGPASVTPVSLAQGAGITNGGAAGTIAIRIGADVTGNMPAGVPATWDLELTSISDATEVIRLAQGSVSVSGQVTE